VARNTITLDIGGASCYHMRIGAYSFTGAQVRNLIKAFKALSDETRVRILKLLLERECCVCEVMQALDISQTRASRNLGLLQDAGFVKSRRDRLWVVYSIDEQGMGRYCSSLLDILRQSPSDNGIIAQDRERLKQAVRVGPGCMRRMRQQSE